ncbi:hypothetical protein GWN63_05340 [Candidatus Bathyarchaeota archaeon]|nr:hypothetical protein [Candidatus Bathyarchaeota archaeon]NIU81648.1 hypothetical protein [Candidatus Bathyarchaeota archaeon]NIV68460.1 hypothetical protein [Candidatus Bathyarchaeota archaeon]NIW16642.1 hypothetical protein [Candidatus Bathyarchaeota archaeon]NIW34836.1 hypothetical protein [Candidatus Bathyarchaeota archaeon]
MRARKIEKDSYDIYIVGGFHCGGPYEAATCFKELIETLGAGALPSATEKALNRIKSGFESPNSYAAQAHQKTRLRKTAL